MNEWRPKDWQRIKIKYCNECLGDVGGADCNTCPAQPFTCNTDFEAGADAILEALWEKLKCFEDSSHMRRLGKYLGLKEE